MVLNDNKRSIYLLCFLNVFLHNTVYIIVLLDTVKAAIYHNPYTLLKFSVPTLVSNYCPPI